MRIPLANIVPAVTAWLMIAGFAAIARAGDDTETRLQRLERRIEAQQEEIRRLEKELGARRTSEDSLKEEMDLLLGKIGGEEDPRAMHMRWDNGIRFATSDREFAFKLGGRFMDDGSWFSAGRGVDEEIGGFPNATEVRRARLYLSGTIYGSVMFKGQYDFAGGDADLKDAYLGLKHLPIVGNVKVGHFKEFWSLEEQTSSKYLTFMERSLVNEALSPGRSIGIGVYDHELDDTVTWGIGFFNETDGYGHGLIGKQISGRVTLTPYREGKDLVHVGVAYNRLDPPRGEARFRARPEDHQAEHPVIDTGRFDLDDADMLGLEGAAVFGPFSAQAEYVSFSGNSVSAGDPRVSGFYVQGSWFLTGESRPYGHGAFGRVKPNANFMNGEGGPGAWQVAVRYSHLDLDGGDLFRVRDATGSRSAPRDGGRVDDVTFGLNWYLNPNTRVRLNDLLSDIGGIGDLRVFAVRFMVDF